MPNRNENKGIALIVVILLIVVISVSVAGIVTYITNDLRLCASRLPRLQAWYAAQAGAYAAINGFRTNGTYAETQNVNFAANNFYSVGRNANFLLINAVLPTVVGNTLSGVTIRNINGGTAPVVNSIKVEWHQFPLGNPVTTATLNRIRLNGAYYQPLSSQTDTLGNGSAVVNVGFSVPNVDAATEWEFSLSIPNNAVILATFNCDEGTNPPSSRAVYLQNLGFLGTNEFSITATGRSGSGNNWSRRTIEATYDVGVNEITSWTESGNHI